MSGRGSPRAEDTRIDGVGVRVAVVTSLWNGEICDMLHARAVDTARGLGAQVSEFRAVGALELPIVVQRAARSGRFDAVVALGCVLRGGTPHFDHVCDAVTAGLSRVALDEHVPVGNGVLTVETIDQARARAGGPGAQEDKGAEAVRAALHTVQVLGQI